MVHYFLLCLRDKIFNWIVSNWIGEQRFDIYTLSEHMKNSTSFSKKKGCSLLTKDKFITFQTILN